MTASHLGLLCTARRVRAEVVIDESAVAERDTREMQLMQLTHAAFCATLQRAHPALDGIMRRSAACNASMQEAAATLRAAAI